MLLTRDGLSIIVPTRGRAQLLTKLLESICADAKNCAFAIETLLADDSRGEEKAAVARLAEVFGTKICEGGDHVGAARNRAAELARFDFLLFLDSDVRIRRGLLAEHWRMLAQGADACLGLTQFHGQRTFAWRVVETMQVMLPFRYPLIASTVPWGPAANISFRKKAFFAVGGFDPTLPAYGGEDLDLGFRFTAAGYRIATSESAAADHSVETWSTWAQNTRRLISYGKADFHLIVRHAARTYIDAPSALLILMLEGFAALALIIAYGVRPWPELLAAIVAAVVAYHATYALLKRSGGGSYWVHFAGPIVITLLDFGKLIECLRNRRPFVMLKRLKYLDDIVQHDWLEIVAGVWGVVASLATFGFIILLLLCLR